MITPIAAALTRHRFSVLVLCLSLFAFTLYQLTGCCSASLPVVFSTTASDVVNEQVSSSEPAPALTTLLANGQDHKENFGQSASQRNAALEWWNQHCTSSVESQHHHHARLLETWIDTAAIDTAAAEFIPQSQCLAFSHDASTQPQTNATKSVLLSNGLCYFNSTTNCALLYLLAVDSSGQPRTNGGDTWTGRLESQRERPTVMVTDFDNGLYAVEFCLQPSTKTTTPNSYQLTLELETTRQDNFETPHHDTATGELILDGKGTMQNGDRLPALVLTLPPPKTAIGMTMQPPKFYSSLKQDFGSWVYTGPSMDEGSFTIDFLSTWTDWQWQWHKRRPYVKNTCEYFQKHLPVDSGLLVIGDSILRKGLATLVLGCGGTPDFMQISDTFRSTAVLDRRVGYRPLFTIHPWIWTEETVRVWMPWRVTPPAGPAQEVIDHQMNINFSIPIQALGPSPFIVLNGALWDIQYNHEISTPKLFKMGLQKMLRHIKTAFPKSKMIYVISTALTHPPHVNFRGWGPYRSQFRLRCFSEIAVEVMRAEQIPTIDASVMTSPTPDGCRDTVHYDDWIHLEILKQAIVELLD